MEARALALWALLAVLAQRGRGAGTGANLSCFRCFKAPAKELCRPAPCAPADRVCVGHTVTFYSKYKVGLMLSKRCAPRCPNSNMAYEWLSESWLFRRVQRQCCNVSFCNAAPPAPGRPGARPGALLLPLGLSLLAAAP